MVRSKHSCDGLHVVRISDDRIPKMLHYGELDSGKRTVSGQKLRYNDVVKRHLKAMTLTFKHGKSKRRTVADGKVAFTMGRPELKQKLRPHQSEGTSEDTIPAFTHALPARDSSTPKDDAPSP